MHLIKNVFNGVKFPKLKMKEKKKKEKEKKKELNPYKNRQKCVNKKISTIKSYRKSLP